MQVIKYQYLSAKINHGTEENPDYELLFIGKTIPCTAEGEALAKAEAYNGEYTIEDDGKPEPDPVPTGDDSVWDELDAAYQEGVDSV